MPMRNFWQALEPLQHRWSTRTTRELSSLLYGAPLWGCGLMPASTNAGLKPRVATYLLVAKGAHRHALDGPAL